VAVQPTANEPRCKICKSAHRPLLEHLLELRSLGKADSEGKRVNFEYFLAVYVEKHDGETIRKESVQNHWKKHCELLSDEEAVLKAEAEAMTNEAKAAIFDRVLGEGWRDRPKTADEYLEVLRELAFVELHDKVITGANTGVTVDHALKGIDSQTRRKSEETAAIVLRQLSAGIGRAVIEHAQKKELPAPNEEDIIDAEVEEVSNA
jgi:hypothetical protein